MNGLNCIFSFVRFLVLLIRLVCSSGCVLMNVCGRISDSWVLLVVSFSVGMGVFLWVWLSSIVNCSRVVIWCVGSSRCLGSVLKVVLGMLW